jgi:hypothetical protein
MRLMVKMVAALAGVSVVSTVWFVAVFAAGDGIGALLQSGLLGVLTLVGWAITLVIGPVAAIQLWRFRQSGRRAAIALFGYGLAYYVVGLLTLRAPDASVWQISGHGSDVCAAASGSALTRNTSDVRAVPAEGRRLLNRCVPPRALLEKMLSGAELIGRAIIMLRP